MGNLLFAVHYWVRIEPSQSMLESPLISGKIKKPFLGRGAAVNNANLTLNEFLD